MMKRTNVFKFIAALFLFVGMFFIAMSYGAAEVSVRDVWLALTTSASGDNISIIRDIRLPREVAAIVVGAALAVSGAMMQGLTQNPLADPGLFGLTAGANAALAITIALLPAANYFLTMVTCFIGAAIGALLVFGISSAKKGGYSSFQIVLAGAAVSAFLYAIAEGIGLYFKISKDISMWTAGGMIGTNWKQLQIIVPFILIGILLAIFLSKQLTVLSLNEEIAIGLGQPIFKVKTLLFVIIIILTGASVALVGNMTFIGLMIPHVVRAIVGTDYRFILPMSAIVGATFMLFADTIGRTLNAPYETPVVAIISVFGLPFFLMIVRRGGKAYV